MNVPYQVSLRRIKNPWAARQMPFAVSAPNSVPGVQECVTFARQYGLKLTVIGGGHSGHCLSLGALAIDLSLMRSVSVDPMTKTVTAAGGATTGDINLATQPYNLSVVLGARPSVGMGLCLHVA